MVMLTYLNLMGHVIKINVDGHLITMFSFLDKFWSLGEVVGKTRISDLRFMRQSLRSIVLSLEST